MTRATFEKRRNACVGTGGKSSIQGSTVTAPFANTYDAGSTPIHWSVAGTAMARQLRTTTATRRERSGARCRSIAPIAAMLGTRT